MAKTSNNTTIQMNGTNPDEIMAIVTQIDLTKTRVLIGDGPKRLFRRVMELLKYRGGIDLVGPSGAGKSHIAEMAAAEYAMIHGVPAFFIQGDAQTTKSATIGGRQMVSGGRVMPVRAAIAEAMRLGGIVFFDELTHSPKMFLTALNTILDPGSKTYIGGDIVQALDTFRIIVCHNTAKYSGNTPLPPSLASRLIAFPVGYPTMEEELQIGIQIAEETVHGTGWAGSAYDLSVPMPVLRYSAWLISYMRGKNALIPVSARNIGSLITLMHSDRFLLKGAKSIDPYFSGSNSKATTTSIAERIFWLEAPKITNLQLMSTDISTFKQWISDYGIEEFRGAVASCYCMNLDIDGISLVALDSLRTELVGSII